MEPSSGVCSITPRSETCSDTACSVSTTALTASRRAIPWPHFPETESHYIASQAAQIDSADIEDAVRLITRKRFGVQNSSQLLILANREYPLVNSYNQRSFGVGVRQRGAAACIQVTTDSTYTKPSDDQIPV